MKKIFLFLFLIIPLIAFSQQINYTWGQTVAGVAYTQIGVQDCDSARIQIVFDMQDYYPYDFNPLFVTQLLSSPKADSVISTTTIASNSNLLYIGTLWYYIDAYRATDSTNYYLIAKSGNMIYQPNDASRITAANIFFGTDSILLVSITRAVGDFTGWKFINVYVNASTDAGSTIHKYLPPEFVEVDFNWATGAADSINVYWNFAYPAIDEKAQSGRSTTRSNGNSRKAIQTLH